VAQRFTAAIQALMESTGFSRRGASSNTTPKLATKLVPAAFG